MSHAQKVHEWALPPETVVLGVGFGRGLGVETTDLDESGGLLMVRSTDNFHIFD